MKMGSGQDAADIIVVGAGSNSLSAAAYLAAAGLEVLVLERNAWIGGGVVTQELTVPGFKHDTHSTVHQFIQANPLIARDELKLQAKYGLEYLKAPLFFTSLFPDGSTLLTYGDLNKSCEAIAKFSARDAESYREFVNQGLKLLPLFIGGLFAPPLSFGKFMTLLDQSAEGRSLTGDLLRSSYDIVTRLFEHPKVQMHLLKWTSEAMLSPETKGTGAMLYLMCGFAHHFECKFPKGGSGQLSHSLQRCIEDHGGRIELNSDVKKLCASGGKATGVELVDGRVISAKKAVIGSIHPTLLNNFLDGKLDKQILKGIERLEHSDLRAINTHYALHAAPRYKSDEPIDHSYIVETQPATMLEFRRYFDEMRYGEIPPHMHVNADLATNHDPTRAPQDKATLYLYTFAPFELAEGGPSRWKDIKEEVADKMLQTLCSVTINMDSSNIIARHVDSPVDFADTSPSFQGGDIVGIGLHLFQFMGMRPTPELSQYKVPGLERFYLCGPCMHPGGGVTGGGRPVALKVMQELGMKTDRLFSM